MSITNTDMDRIYFYLQEINFPDIKRFMEVIQSKDDNLKKSYLNNLQDERLRYFIIISLESDELMEKCLPYIEDKLEREAIASFIVKKREAKERYDHIRNRGR